MFDSWGGQLPPRDWDKWSGPYLTRMIATVKARHPRVPITLYANGSGGLLERMGKTGADVIGLDWTVDMADARRRLGDVSVQVRFERGGWATLGCFLVSPLMLLLCFLAGATHNSVRRRLLNFAPSCTLFPPHSPPPLTPTSAPPPPRALHAIPPGQRGPHRAVCRARRDRGRGPRLPA